MSFLNFIKKLQDQPRYIRVQILYFSVVVLMLMIVSFWAISMKGSLSLESIEKSPKFSKNSEKIEKLPSIRESLGASATAFSKGISGAREGFRKIMINFNSSNNEEDINKENEEDIIQLKENEEYIIKPIKLPVSQ